MVRKSVPVRIIWTGTEFRTDFKNTEKVNNFESELFFQFFEILVRTTYRTKFESGPKSVPRTVLKKIRTENPYHVPYHLISDQKPLPRTKIRTGSDFQYGTAV